MSPNHSSYFTNGKYNPAYSERRRAEIKAQQSQKSSKLSLGDLFRMLTSEIKEEYNVVRQLNA